MRRLLILSALALPAFAGSAAAAGPAIMPLSQVHAGMHCTAATVVKGTTITTFDVDIVDIVTQSPSDPSSDLILFKASGPAVDDTGIAEGMSGSPITCLDGNGVPRIAGAVSYGTGDYGGSLALATPIQSVLQTPVDPPAHVRVARSLIRHAHRLTSPLVITGLSPSIAASLTKAGAKRGRTIVAAPARPRGLTPPAPLQPGSSLSTLYSDGDIVAGAIGTVTYTDGAKVWGFGHPLDGAGQRSLILGDAYIYSVVGTPLDVAGATSYKFGAPVNDLGTLTADGPYGVAGVQGALPEVTPITVTATSRNTGKTTTLRTNVANERLLGEPLGFSPLPLLGMSAVAQAAYTTLQGSPPAQHGQMCLTITLEGQPKPAHFCNSYVGAQNFEEGGTPMAGDVANALDEVASYSYKLPRITDVHVTMSLGSGDHQAFLQKVTAPKVARAGHKVKLRVTMRRTLDGTVLTRDVSIRIPKGTAPGSRKLTLTGAGLDPQFSDGLGSLLDEGDSGDLETSSNSAGPKNLPALIKAVNAIKRKDGVVVTLGTGNLSKLERAVGDARSETAFLKALKKLQKAAKASTLSDRILGGDALRVSGTAKTSIFVR
jgi:hypothetical protein